MVLSAWIPEVEGEKEGGASSSLRSLLSSPLSVGMDAANAVFWERHVGSSLAFCEFMAPRLHKHLGVSGSTAQLLAEIDRDCDLVSGWKKKRHDPISKTLPSRFFNRVTSLVAGIRLHDINCGLKAYRREVTEDALPYLYGELYRFLPAIAHWAGYRVSEIPVQHHPRRFGYSKFGAKRLLNGFLDLLTVTFVVRFMTTPMHVFGSLGLLSTLCGTVVCAYIALLRYEHGNIQNRHPLLMLGVLLVIVGIQFFSTGFLGDMLASMHQRGGRTPRIIERLNEDDQM